MDQRRYDACMVILEAFKYRDNPIELSEFILKNRSYFPNISDDYLNNLRNLKNASNVSNVIRQFRPLTPLTSLTQHK